MGSVRRSAHHSESESARPLPMGRTRWQAVVRELKLTHRQAEIVAGVLRAMTDKQIAEEMGLKTPTIRTYLERICKRLGVTGRLQLVLRVMQVAEAKRCEECPHK